MSALLPALAAAQAIAGTRPFLNMPPTAAGRIPEHLSETGAFASTRELVPNKDLLPYDLIVPFWSDGAGKKRLVALPLDSGRKIGFSPTGDWKFPAGTVFVKTFELPVDERKPGSVRRVETRLLVVGRQGSVYGVVYRWRADQSDADLLSGARSERIPVTTAGGEERAAPWYYPSREDCLKCHTAATGGVLGVKTRQLNRPITYPDGHTENELVAWSRLGAFDIPVAEGALDQLPRLAATEDRARSIDDRARSWLDANCSNCHRPGGTVAGFDLRYDIPHERQGLINGPILIDEGIDRARVVSPHDPWRSILLMRVNTTGNLRMPPLARQTIDTKGAELLRQWISQMPGRDVVPPPALSRGEGTYAQPIDLVLTDPEPGVDIRYTLDGSVPTSSDLHYEAPIHIDGDTVFRARAFKEGMTRSIVVQSVYVVSGVASQARQP